MLPCMNIDIDIDIDKENSSTQGVARDLNPSVFWMDLVSPANIVACGLSILVKPSGIADGLVFPREIYAWMTSMFRTMVVLKSSTPASDWTSWLSWPPVM